MEKEYNTFVSKKGEMYVLSNNEEKLELTGRDFYGLKVIYEEVKSRLQYLKPRSWKKYLPSLFSLAQMLKKAREFEPSLDGDGRYSNLPEQYCRYAEFFAGWAGSVRRARSSGLSFNFNYFIRIEIYPDGSWYVDYYTSTRYTPNQKGVEMNVFPDIKIKEPIILL